MSTVADVMERKERPAYVRFETRPIEDKAASLEKGHYIARDVDYVLLTPPYSKDVNIFKVEQWFKQLEHDQMAERIPRSWVENYKQAYQAWKRGQELPLNGTPIKGWGVVSPAQQETLIRMNILTVEDLAKVNDEGIKRIGMGAVDLKHKADAWLSQLSDKGPLTQEIASVKARNRELEIAIAALTKRVEDMSKEKGPSAGGVVAPAADEITASELLEPSREELVDAYTKKHGKPPHHRMSDKTIAAAL